MKWDTAHDANNAAGVKGRMRKQAVVSKAVQPWRHDARLACRVHLCMGPLRASAELLVTFGYKSNRRSLAKALSYKLNLQLI